MTWKKKESIQDNVMRAKEQAVCVKSFVRRQSYGERKQDAAA